MKEKEVIKIKVPNTRFWIFGHQKTNNLWDAYLFDPRTQKEEIIKENITTLSFSIVSNLILKTPLPYEKN